VAMALGCGTSNGTTVATWVCWTLYGTGGQWRNPGRSGSDQTAVVQVQALKWRHCPSPAIAAFTPEATCWAGPSDDGASHPGTGADEGLVRVTLRRQGNALHLLVMLQTCSQDLVVVRACLFQGEHAIEARDGLARG
jgi:hypothetical protein